MKFPEKVHVMPTIIALASLIWLIMAIERWWRAYPDLSQLTLAVLISIIGFGASYTYNWIKNHDETYLKDKEFGHNRLDVLYDEIVENGENLRALKEKFERGGRI